MILKEEQRNPRGSRYRLGPRNLDCRWVRKDCLWVREVLRWVLDLKEVLRWVLDLKEWLTSSHCSASQDTEWGRQGGR